MPALHLTRRQKLTALIATNAVLLLAIVALAAFLAGSATAGADSNAKPTPTSSAPAADETDEQAGARLLAEGQAALKGGDLFAAEELFSNAYDAYVRAGDPDRQQKALDLVKKSTEGRVLDDGPGDDSEQPAAN
ncbi:hypothetical protein [Microbacterium sp. 77mftsu3.1]|uniref:hypothetical protein n=1 Tax=Microbacterium sp. 77mftsu3.1 TaxID=1761802 RepID=UPI000890B58E|nr:hypothetical protein [Microbacterium sp. 77mftsu3.1]SDH32846.1 hypothetical protein SAMN04488590_3039 [Microbacterium sp. 77mftsu3.1]